MRLHEEQRGEVGHARAFGGASCFAAESGEMMTDVGVEAFEPLRVHLAGEMCAFRQHGRVGGEIVGEGDPTLSLGKRFEKALQVVGASSAHMNAEDASCEITHRYPQPAFVFFA